MRQPGSALYLAVFFPFQGIWYVLIPHRSPPVGLGLGTPKPVNKTATLYKHLRYSGWPVSHTLGRANLKMPRANTGARRLRWSRAFPRHPFYRIGRWL